MKRARRAMGTTIVAVLMLACCGCPSEPPSVKSVKEIDRLDPSTKTVDVRELTDADIPALARFHAVEDLDFARGWGAFDAPITDQGLRTLSTLDLPKLDYLMLWNCRHISDAGLAAIGEMKNVRHLMLVDCPITDEGLAHLVKMQQLVYLDLRGNAGITDRGLERLAEKSNWQEIMLGGCRNVTPAAVTRLQAKYPKARIKKDEQEWSWEQK
jgi:hypothetical protein